MFWLSYTKFEPERADRLRDNRKSPTEPKPSWLTHSWSLSCSVVFLTFESWFEWFVNLRFPSCCLHLDCHGCFGFIVRRRRRRCWRWGGGVWLSTRCSTKQICFPWCGRKRQTMKQRLRTNSRFPVFFLQCASSSLFPGEGWLRELATFVPKLDLLYASKVPWWYIFCNFVIHFKCLAPR